ncbi:helix-turn-helix domain-containing protein [Streptomyces radiopugnans]|nr:helix-turn-helix domain-containing protein [Streptomyces radiopugnans]
MTPNGAAIRDFREARGMRLRQLADLVGIAPSFLSRIESGQRGARGRTLHRIAEELNVQIESITREKPRDQE